MRNLIIAALIAGVTCTATGLHLEAVVGDAAGAVPPPPNRMSSRGQVHRKAPNANKNLGLRDGMAMDPSNTDRSLTCPVRFAKADIPSDYYPYTADLRSVTIDTTTIPRVLPELASYFNNTVVIMIKRDLAGTPYYKYLTANGNTYDEPAETWSSSKIFAAMNGAGNLRSKCNSAESKGAAGGLHEFIDGKKGRTPLGDLVTVICSYMEEDYTSNSLANWFEMVGGRQRMNGIIRDWIHSNSSADSTLGGGYGAAPPSDLLNFDFYPPADGGCKITPDSATSSISNHISALQAAELTRRIAMVREEPSLAMPDTTWDDTEVLFYGPPKGTSTLFPSLEWGGMSSCEFPINTFGVNLTHIDAVSKGKWRAFGKDGYGCSSSRFVEERLFNGYACYPSEAEGVSDEAGKQTAVKGVEFVYSTRLSIPGCPETSDKYVTTAAEMLNKAILDGRIQ